MIEESKVKVSTDRSDFWLGVVEKKGKKAAVIADQEKLTLYVFGGDNMTICKYKKLAKNKENLMKKFLRTVGKLCKMKSVSRCFTNEGGTDEVQDRLVLDRVEWLKKQ